MHINHTDRYVAAGAYRDVYTPAMDVAGAYEVYLPGGTLIGEVCPGPWGDNDEKVYSASFTSSALFAHFPYNAAGFQDAIVWIITSYCVANYAEE